MPTLDQLEYVHRYLGDACAAGARGDGLAAIEAVNQWLSAEIVKRQEPSKGQQLKEANQ